jgi:tetratricopeptide (TPR) repeat protein
MSFVISGKISKILTIISPFIALAGIVILQSQEYKKSVQKLNNADYLAQEQEQAKSVDWQKQTAHLDFENLKADWSYLDFVQYFGDAKARDTIGYKLVPEYFEAITTIDPRFTTAYLNLAIANSMYAGHPEKTIALMEQVLESVDPASEQAALLWTSKGLDELLFMGDKQEAIESYEMAAKWQSLTNQKRSDGLTIKDLELALKDTDEIDLKEAQIRAWSSVLVYVRAQPRQREIIDKIASLKVELAALEQANTHQP